MNVEAMHGEVGPGGVEVLVIDAALLAAIDGIGKVAAEPGHVKGVRARADLLVGRKAHRHAAVRYALAYQALQHGHYLGHARLVVAAQQRGAVGGYQRAAGQLLKVREV